MEAWLYEVRLLFYNFTIRMKEEFTDKDLGKVLVIRNTRAKSAIARRKPECIQLTVPVYFSLKQILKVFEEMKPRLQSLKVKPKFIFDTETVLQAVTFSLKIESQSVKNFHARLEDGLLTVVCPDRFDFADSIVQNTIRNTIENTLRAEANRVFPSRLKELADIHGFEYSVVRINKSRTRWGSCSAKKSINLSYYCMLLPSHLLDLVILHELCHTVEMNHGERFWQLLDKVTGNRAGLLTRELKNVRIEW